MLELSRDVPRITPSLYTMRTSGGRRALLAALSAMSRQRASTENRENLVTLLQREWSRSREPTTRSTPRDHHAVMPQQPSFPLPQAQRRPPVAKTVTTGPVLVFVAGVEGTGHHMLCAALTPRHPHCRAEPCFKVDKRLDALVRQCPNAPMPHACANAPMHHYADVSMRQRRHAPSSSLRAARGATLARRCSNGCAATTSH